MDELENNSLKKVFTKRRIELVIGIVLLLIVAVIFFAFLSNSSQQGQPTEIFEESQNNYDVLPLTLTNEIAYNNYKATLTSGWEVNETFDGRNSEDIYCEDTTECVIHMVYNGTNVYYISLPTPFTHSQFSSSTKEVTKSFPFGEVQFTEYQLQTENLDIGEDGETITDASNGEVLIGEIVGCFEDTICFNSGRLTITPEDNAKAVQAFYDFVGTVTVTK
jgi:hypothetical protein